MTVECSALAFYGADASEPLAAGFYDLVVWWLKSIGHPPTQVGVRSKDRYGKLAAFSGMEAILRTEGFAGIIGISLYAMDSDEGVPMTDYLVSSSYSEPNSYALVVARSSLATLSQASMAPLAKSIIRELNPKYGIGYTRPLSQGADLYAIGLGLGDGIGQSEGEREETLRRARWSDAMTEHIWDRGLLREVYPWNFLTHHHLSRPVGGKTLEQWITQGPGHGTLMPIAEGMSMWEVPAARITNIQKTLWDADVIFNWRQHLS